MTRLPFALGLAFSTAFASLAGAQQLPGEDPLWPRELRAEGRQAGELRRLRRLAREHEEQLTALREKLAEATKEAEARRPTSQPAEQAQDQAQVDRLRRQVELLQGELERARAAQTPEAPAPEAPALEAPAPEAPALAPEPAPLAPAFEAPLSPAPAPFAEREELPASAGADRTLSIRVRPQGGIPAARRELAEDVLQRVYGRQVLSLLTQGEVERLCAAVQACFREERLEGGMLRLRCHEGEALARSLDVLGLDSELMAEPFLVVTNRFEGPSDAARIAGAAFTDALQSFRFRAAGRGQRAPLVVSLSGRLAFASMPRGSAHAQLYRGQLRCQAVRVRVYYRPSNQVLLHSAISSNPELRADEGHTTSELYQPWIARDASAAEVGERYAEAVGRTAAQRVARMLLVEILRGRGHSALSPQAFDAPTGTTPLASGAPAPLSEVPQALTHEVAMPRPSHYVLRFAGLSDVEVDEAIEDLQRNARFQRWKHVSSTGDVHVYACDYSGRGVVLRLREALVDADVSVRKRGPRLTIRAR